MDTLAALARDAAVRYGVVDRAELRSVGMSDSQIHRSVKTGKLRRAASGAFVFPAAPRSWRQDVLIAVTSAGTPALASHQTAANLHGLIDLQPRSIEVVMPRWDRSRQDYIVHESKDLLPQDATVVASIPATTATRTVVDLGASAPRLVERALERGIRAEQFTLQELAGFVARVGRKGRRGVGVIRPLIDERLHWDGVTESALEDLLRRAWGVRQPRLVPQYIIESDERRFICRADFAFPRHRLRIELDSEAFHMDRPTFRKDRVIQNRTELLGWRTLRYTWWDLTKRPGSVVREIEAALSIDLPA